MLKVQKRAVELLKEIDDICIAENIHYSLAGRTAAMQAAKGGFTCQDYRPEIMMLPDDYRKFCKAVSERNDPSRTIESLETNPQMDGIYARYVDTSTTLIDFNRGAFLKAQGVHVLIWILRSKKPSSLYSKTLETIVKSNRNPNLDIKKKYRNGKAKTKLTAVGIARGVFRHPNTMKKYFSTAIADDKKNKTLYYQGLAEYGRKIVMPRKYMNKYKRVPFEDIEVMACEKISDFVKNNYDEKQMKGIYRPYNRVSEWGVYYDLHRPYDQVICSAKADGINFDKLSATIADYNEFFATDFKKWDNLTNQQYWNVNRTIDRFDLLQEYDGRTDEIVAMYESGDIDQTREALSHYIELLKLYSRRKMGFCMDSRLLNIAYEIMERDGNGDIVKQSKSMMPKEFEEDLADWLIAQGYVRNKGSES